MSSLCGSINHIHLELLILIHGTNIMEMIQRESQNYWTIPISISSNELVWDFCISRGRTSPNLLPTKLDDVRLFTFIARDGEADFQQRG